ncbi:hypothetical protein M407DRAFT_149362 [Tulasnella calospora MUT 4182]|uniref:Uncharacterized protein n=1 Tax=Tulasnella calospora MUT 4182 TaxID=1051891 RepID=A0A0C3KCR2_9AGAM|nr:hypothetical protein M407DRAFT_149362 [Tulasnella calospora MUT 4182]
MNTHKDQKPSTFFVSIAARYLETPAVAPPDSVTLFYRFLLKRSLHISSIHGFIDGSGYSLPVTGSLSASPIWSSGPPDFPKEHHVEAGTAVRMHEG